MLAAIQTEKAQEHLTAFDYISHASQSYAMDPTY